MPTTFGEQVTADHLIANRVDNQGHYGSKYAVVVYDLATRYRDCFPIGDKDAIDARLALQQFIGPKAIVQSFHCDGAKEYIRPLSSLAYARAPHFLIVLRRTP